MRHLAGVVHGRLHWAQPHMLDRAYDLRSGDETVATLRFRSAFGSLATGTSADGSWTFKRIGFCDTRATVRREDSPDNLAVFEHRTWGAGGTLTMPVRRSIRVTTNFWQSKIEFLTDDDAVLFRYLTEGFVRQESQLEVMPPLLRMPELPWLILFGWYLVVMMHHDSAATAAIVS